MAISIGPEMVEVVYAAWLAAGLVTGLEARITDRLDHFILPV